MNEHNDLLRNARYKYHYWTQFTYLLTLHVARTTVLQIVYLSDGCYSVYIAFAAKYI